MAEWLNSLWQIMYADEHLDESWRLLPHNVMESTAVAHGALEKVRIMVTWCLVNIYSIWLIPPPPFPTVCLKWCNMKTPFFLAYSALKNFPIFFNNEKHTKTGKFMWETKLPHLKTGFSLYPISYLFPISVFVSLLRSHINPYWLFTSENSFFIQTTSRFLWWYFTIRVSQHSTHALP